MEQPLTFARKLTTCLVAGLTSAATLLLLGNGGGLRWFPPAIVFSLAGLSLLAAIAFPLWWHLRKPGQAASERRYGFLLAAIRYLTAFNISSFGWKKIFGLQFVVPPTIASQPANQLSGEWLTWFYFGYSPTFGFIIAALQLLGGCLLLFRRTVLLGTVLLCAVLLNLSLINIFYHLNAGALLQSLVATLDVLFLLGLYYHQLLALFLPANSSAVPFRHRLPTLAKLSVILLSLLFAGYLKAIASSR